MAGRDKDASRSLQKSAVEGVLLHLTASHRVALEMLEKSVSQTVAVTMEAAQQRLVIVLEDDPTKATSRKRVISADLQFTREEFGSLPNWAQKLASTCPEIATKYADKHINSIRIAWGVAKESTNGDAVEQKLQWQIRLLDVTMFLQQLVLQLADKALLEQIPSSIRGGIGQEVAQQVTSHIQLLDSGTVLKAELPTISDRNSELARKQWEDAIQTVCTYALPFSRERARILDPGKYAAEDPRGDRLINIDPMWARVLKGPTVKSLPLLFVSGSSIRIVKLTLPRKHAAGHKHTFTATYLVLPVSREWINSLPGTVQEKVQWWKKPDVLATQELLVGKGALKKSANTLVIPISAGKKRFFNHILPALQRGFPLQWQRIVGRSYRRPATHRKWFAQLTIGYTNPSSLPEMALGIHFGMKDILWWALADKQGNILKDGSIPGNSILDFSLQEKGKIERQQKAGKNVAGKKYGKSLLNATYRVVNGVLEFSKGISAEHASQPIGLGLETIRFVDKASGSSPVNARHSNWNYGQLSGIFANKAGPAGFSVTEITLKKAQRDLSDAEQARVLAIEATKRFASRIKRLATKRKDDTLFV